MDHIAKIAAQLPDHGLDAMMIVSEPGERYALGFQGEGLLLVTKDGAQYSTDGRYIEAARERIAGAEVVLTTPAKGHLAFAKEHIQAKGLHNIGFESGAMTV
ncbi:MAG: Xaa-Pro dipeptidase, partial [Lawsonibacter sp.]|nr:Xaa-Pro dipeptidase [Lawsonibacter sp.]